MTNESQQPSLALRNPPDPSVIRVIRSLDPVARAAGCAYFVAGATARDLILVNVHGLRPGRATRDIDFGIAVESWAQFARLKDRLIATGEFSADRRALQRLIYMDQAAGFSIPVDLIPFRGVTSADETVTWPPGRDLVMNVAGFEEALASSVLIEMEVDLPVRVASIPGLTVLKLAAWADRGRENNKDAADLYRLLTAYADAGNIDRIYDHELDLLEAAEYNMELAGAELLGRDVANIGSSHTMDQVRSLLASEENCERLVRQMAQTTYAEAAPTVGRIASYFFLGLLSAPPN
jgi:predicted nucleotidyltransferase